MYSCLKEMQNNDQICSIIFGPLCFLHYAKYVKLLFLSWTMQLKKHKSCMLGTKNQLKYKNKTNNKYFLNWSSHSDLDKGSWYVTLGWPRFKKRPEKLMLAVFSESYGILEWENTFGFVSGYKSTLLKHHEIYKGNS